MFYNCSSLKSLDLTNFNISQVSNMTSMFYNCKNLSFLNLSNFDTSGVNEKNEMFYNCSSLNVINIFNFNISNIYNLTSIFNGYQNSEYININIYNSNIEKEIFLLTYPYMVICEKNDDNFIEPNLFTKKIIYLLNNKRTKTKL